MAAGCDPVLVAVAGASVHRGARSSSTVGRRSSQRAALTRRRALPGPAAMASSLGPRSGAVSGSVPVAARSSRAPRRAVPRGWCRRAGCAGPPGRRRPRSRRAVMLPATRAEPISASSRESSLAGAGEADEGAALLVHVHVVQRRAAPTGSVAGVDEVVVEVERLAAGRRCSSRRCARSASRPSKASEDRVEPRRRRPSLSSSRTSVSLAFFLISATAWSVRRAAAQIGEGVGGAGVGEVDEGLAALAAG